MIDLSYLSRYGVIPVEVRFKNLESKSEHDYSNIHGWLMRGMDEPSGIVIRRVTRSLKDKYMYMEQDPSKREGLVPYLTREKMIWRINTTICGEEIPLLKHKFLGDTGDFLAIGENGEERGLVKGLNLLEPNLDKSLITSLSKKDKKRSGHFIDLASAASI